MPFDQHSVAPALFKKQTGLAWARGFYLAGLMSALAFMLPVSWFPFQTGKLALFGFFLLLSTLLFTTGGGWKGFWRSSGVRPALLVTLLPVVYMFSAYISNTLPGALLGTGNEVDSVVFVTLASVAFLLGFALFRTARAAWVFSTTLFTTLAVVTLVQLGQIVLGDTLLSALSWGDKSINMIGKWNDLGIAVALLLLITILRLEFSSLVRMRVLGLGTLVAALCVLLSFINFSFVWGLLFVVLVVVIVFKLLHAPIAPSEERQLNWRQHMPWVSFAAAALLVGGLFFGTTVNAFLTQYFPVSAVEVRPSFSSTRAVIDAARGDSVTTLLLGTGPTTFNESWLMHRSADVNRSLFWNLDFVVGFSTVVTAVGTVGLVGALAWLVAPLLVAVAFLRALRTQLFRSRERTMALTFSLGSLFLAFSYIFYIPSQNLVLLAFGTMGVAFGFLWRSAQKERDVEEVDSTRIATLGRALVALLVVVVVFASATLTIRRALADVFVLQGQSALVAGQTDAALFQATRAAWFESTDNVHLLSLAAGFVQLQQIANDSSVPTATAQERFSTTLTATIATGEQAMVHMKEDYRPYVLMGNIYSFLASLKVQGAYENARAAYETAALYNPKNPEIPLALARLEAAQGTEARAEAAVTTALTLKPDYTDAILFVAQLAAAKNDIQGAIRAAEVAVQTAPGVSSIWFQLGLLYYTNNAMDNAIVALERAIQLTPEYANAKYFLGLAYYKQNRAQDAIRLFEQLQRENPDNTEVSLILSNMRFGKQPLDGVQPPATNPEDRSTAPISE